MARKRKTELEKRLIKLEELFDRNKISEKQLDVLDAVARCEAGLLSYDEAFDEYTRRE